MQRARKRANAADDATRRWIAFLLPVVAIVFGGAFLTALVLQDQITEAVGIAGMALGWLIRDASSVTGFHSGTSLGSKKKREELETAAERRS